MGKKVDKPVPGRGASRRLPPARPRPSTSPPPPTPGKGPLFWLFYLAIFVAIVWLNSRLNPRPRNVTLPQELVGVWRTEAPLYATRRFVVASNVLLFQTADDSGSFAEYYATGIRSFPHERGVLYIVEYSESVGGKPQTLELIYRAGPPTEIEFRHQPGVVWRRAWQ